MPEVLQYGTRVVVLRDGALAADMTWEGAAELGKALIAAARKAEEWAKAQEVAADAAVLMRAGFPIGLAHHPAVVGEAYKVSQGDRELRRHMRNNVSNKSVVGTPRVMLGNKS